MSLLKFLGERFFGARLVTRQRGGGDEKRDEQNGPGESAIAKTSVPTTIAPSAPLDDNAPRGYASAAMTSASAKPRRKLSGVKQVRR